MKISALLIIFKILLSTYQAGATEVFSVLLGECMVQNGIIIHVDEDLVTIINFDGQLSHIKRSQIQGLIVYNSIQNPIKAFHLTEMSREYLKTVYLSDGNHPTFVGWPVKFIHNLVQFVDIEGKSQVIEIEKIKKIRPSRLEPGHYPVEKYEAAVLMPIEGFSCVLSESAKDGIRSSRQIVDQIQINEYLDTLSQGYANLNGFQERTYLYARPLIYEMKARLGLHVAPQSSETVPHLPLYVQWGTGAPYQVQSFTQIGSADVEWSPSLERQPILRSEVKSHLFHAAFVGNLNDVSPGKSVNTKSLSVSKGSLNASEKGINFDAGRDHSIVILGYNHMALMGVDFGPYSFSYGTYYPATSLYAEGKYREVLASSISRIYRAQYTKEKFRLRGIYSSYFFESHSQATDKFLAVSDEVFQNIRAFSFQGHFFRLGLDYFITSAWIGQFDYTNNHADYNESFYEVNSDQVINNKLSFTNQGAQVSLSRAFSRYVQLRFFMRQHLFKRESYFLGLSNQKEYQTSVFGGDFEFVF